MVLPNPAAREARKTIRNKTIGNKLGWFVGIWIASILALAVIAYGIKLLLR